MIKKSKFEDEIMFNMHNSLASQNETDLSVAIDYLVSAMDILSENGFQSKADQILDVISKIAANVITMPSIKFIENALNKFNISLKDLSVLKEPTLYNNRLIKAKVLKALRIAGLSDDTIINFVGGNKTISLIDSKLVDYILKSEKSIKEMIEIPNEISAIAKMKQNRNKRPADLRKIIDPHTHNLTSDKMVANLLHHGTTFNASDDGNIDLLNANIDEDLEVIEDESQPSFEDEI